MIPIFICIFVLICTLCIRGRDRNPQRWGSVPRTIMLTTKDKKQIPGHILQQYEKYAPEYRLRIFDDEDCRQFLRRNYAPRVLDKFDTLKMGAYKADLFRYAYLYKEGGCYMDVKTILTRPLREVFGEHEFYLVQGMHSGTIYNGVILTPPYNPYILELLSNIVHDRVKGGDYLKNVRDAHRVLVDRYCTRPLHPGLNRTKNIPDLYLLREKYMNKKHCGGKLDKHGYCMICVDEDDQRVFNIRDPTYGSWK